MKQALVLCVSEFQFFSNTCSFVLFVFQILSLGAGFDSLYFRLQSAGCLHNTLYVEVGQPKKEIGSFLKKNYSL